MHDEVLKLLNENKNGSNLFNSALRNGNKEKLEKYFEIAKKHNINLFDYHEVIGNNCFVIAMEMFSKMIKKAQKERNLDDYDIEYDVKIREEIREDIKKWHVFLQENGMNLFTRSLKEIDGSKSRSLNYPYLRTLEYEDVKFSDFIKEIILENENKEHYLSIKNDMEFIRLLSEVSLWSKRFNQIFLEMRENNSFEENILLINPAKINSLYSLSNNNNYKYLFEDFKKELNKNHITEEMINSFNFILEHHKYPSFILDFVKKTGIDIERLKKMVFPESKLKIDMPELKQMKEIKKWNWKYDPLTFEFLEMNNKPFLEMYLEKIMVWNNHSNEKLKFEPDCLSSDAYLRIITSLIRKEKFQREMSVGLEKIQKMIKELNIKTNDSYVWKMFNYIENLHNNGKSLDKDEFEFMLKNLVPKKDIYNEIENIKILFKENKLESKKHFNNEESINEKIIVLLELIEGKNSIEFINDLPLKKIIKILSKSDVMISRIHQKNVLDFFDINKIKDTFFKYGHTFDNEYANHYKKEVKKIMLSYAKIKKSNLENMPLVIEKSLEKLLNIIKNKEDPKLFNVELEKMIILLSVSTSYEEEVKMKKRL